MRISVLSALPAWRALLRLAGLALLLVPSQLHASERIALLIANSSYAHTRHLPNPPNDIALIAGKLKELGFKVRVEKDLDARRLSETIEDFSKGLTKQSEALFYYAGHGLQFGGENFLVGVDARLSSEATLQFETFRLVTALNLLEANAGTTLLFWDACRNNPLADALARTGGSDATGSTGGVTRNGAARMAPSRSDTLVMFSAAPGKLALDGDGRNSPFAIALEKYIGSPNVEVESMLKQVTREVMEQTGHKQQPERVSKLTRDFYFQRTSGEQVADEEEILRLRAKLAMLERSSAVAPPSARFQIVSLGAARPKRNTIFRDFNPEVETGATPVPSSPGADAAPPVAGASGPSRDAADIIVSVEHEMATIIRKLAVSPDGRFLALGDDEGLVRVIALDSFSVVQTIEAHSKRISDLDFSPDSTTLLTAGRDGLLRYWDVASGRSLRELSQPGSIPYSARMNSANPDRWVLMGDYAGKLVAWDLVKNRIITNSKFHDGPVNSVDYRPDGSGTFLSGAGDGELKVRLPEGQRSTLRAHRNALFTAGYSHSGKLVYTTGGDRVVKLWDADNLQSAQPKAVLEGHLRYVLTADMSRDDRLLATGGGDKAINIWNVATGDLLRQLKGHTGDVEAVAFTPNGKIVVSASEDKTVRLWSVDDGSELVTLVFEKAGAKYAGVALGNQSFGDRNTALLTVYADSVAVPQQDAEKFLPYVGREITIEESSN